MKTCFKCNQLKPFSDFYKHPKMTDGLLGKCKSCTKKDTADRAAEKAKDPLWIESELERHRNKSRRYREGGLVRKLTAEETRLKNARQAERHPVKMKARQAVSNALRDGKLHRQPCRDCGSQKSHAHHDDYSKPLEVIWLCAKHHAEHHVELRRQQRAAA